MGMSQRDRFLADYGEYVEAVLRPTKLEVETLLGRLRARRYWAKYQTDPTLPIPSPIHRVRTRIKRPESAEDKIQRKPESFPDGLCQESLRCMYDAVGTRIICFFLSDLPLVDKEIRQLDEIELSEDDPPIAYLPEEVWNRLGLQHIVRKENPSGYASIHYIMRLKGSSVAANNRPWFELQVRTLTEDVWAEIEHLLGYKPDKKTFFAVKEQFRILSKLLGAVDEHFDFLRDELERLQRDIKIDEEAKLNPENLPRVLSSVGVGVAQLDIDGLLKILASYGIETVEELRKLAQPADLKLIRREWETRVGSPPDNFSVIATLASFRDVRGVRTKQQRIREQIALWEFWRERGD